MNLDNELQELWRSELPPAHLAKTMRKVRRHRTWWIAQRLFEAAGTVFVAHHYLTHQGSEVGHWLYLPIALVSLPALWILVYKNAAIARAHSALGARAYLQLRVEQMQAALREVRFLLVGALALMGYAISSWWVMRIANADEHARLATEGLLVLTSVAALAIGAFTLWRRRYYLRELETCARALRELDE